MRLGPCRCLPSILVLVSKLSTLRPTSCTRGRPARLETTTSSVTYDWTTWSAPQAAAAISLTPVEMKAGFAG
ncbi:hypothetical protein GE09DRAFT_1098655 [Coniochaeta sp. 2T2.1]|nr:hypothetical protein GE09DRAFT_1098655 [Coniochaeta sp. 2T2.1]